MKPIFNYIITIHNKEELIAEVLNAVIKCCGNNSFIYPVLDGCTDRSELIIDEIILANPAIPITKIKLDDVHEIISINEGLKRSDQTAHGYNIILQDDVILQDPAIEKTIGQIYKTAGSKLGYLSFRLGANISASPADADEGSPFVDYIESTYGHGIEKGTILLPGQLAFRHISIKSPVCIPTEIINQFGFLDEALAPCFHDDTEYSLRLLKKGYKNAVFSLKYQSDIEWGGTRKKPDPDLQKLIKKNITYVKKKYGADFLNTIAAAKENEIITIKAFTDLNERQAAVNQYKVNNNNRLKFALKGMSLAQRIKYRLKTFINKSQ